MKKVLNLLFLCVCLLLIGCEKGEDIAYYTDDLLEKNEIDDVEVFFESRSYDNQNAIWYYGLRKGKEWFALFDKSANSLIQEWYGKKQSAKELDPISSLISGFPYPAKLDNNEYLLWYLPFVGRLGNNECQLVHLKVDGSVEYGKILGDGNKYEPLFFIGGKGWFSKGGNDVCIYDPAFENIIIENIVQSRWDSLQVFIGFYGDRLWLGFMNDKLELSNEYLSENAFEKKRKVYLGYGEYKEYTVKAVSTGMSMMADWGMAFILTYYTTSSEHISQDIVLLNEDKAVLCTFDDEINNIRKWYKESVLVDDKYVISPQGKKMYEGNFPDPYPGYQYFPISYSSWLTISRIGISMFSADDINQKWHTSFKNQPANNAKVTYVLLDNDESFYTFRCDIVNYDGSKDKFMFKVNVTNGELTYLF